ncbi:MAG: sulfatase-like hydrolase/transferase, partial [Myxococcota bacterium]
MSGWGSSALRRPVLVGGAVACFEVLWVALAAHEPLGALDEWARFALASLAVCSSCCLLAWAAGSCLVRLSKAAGVELDSRTRRRSARRVGTVVAGIAFGASVGVLWVLTDGRRLEDVPWRVPVVVLAGFVPAVVAGVTASRAVQWTRGPGRGSWGGSFLFATVGWVLLVLDGVVLRRLYPALHLALCAAGMAALLVGALLVPLRRPSVAGVWPAAVAGGLLLFAPSALRAVMSNGNASFVVEQWAPVTGKLVGAARRVHAASDPVRPMVAAEVPAVATSAGLDLAGNSVLVITVDALRADRLAAYGGRGVTPHLDALTEEAAVFTRAYTPAPHTSYALGSLWTGTDLRATHALGRKPRARDTVAARLTGAGYRTAAFYPPAVFHVDAERFAALAEAGLGFAEREVGHAPASVRVRQLRRYLEDQDDGEPLFLWVHLFEPHEPYDPPAVHARGDGREDRYDGEVAAADAAVGAMVAAFRRHRPRGTVVVTSDHGEELGDHGGHYHGTTLYDEQARVPMLWSSPGRVPPQRLDAPVDLPDLAATLLPALGVPPPAGMHGDDVGPLLAGRGGGPRYAFASLADTRMATDGQFKALCTVGRPGCRLYDLANDPGERRNVAAARPDEVRRLQAAMARHLGRVASANEADDVRALLDRARLGDPTAGPALVPLLGEPEPSVRAEAARALERFRQVSARTVLRRLARRDPA